MEGASGDVAFCCCDDGVGEFASGGVDVVVEDGVPVGCFEFFVELFPAGLAEVSYPGAFFI